MPRSPSIELGIADQADDVVSGDPSSSVLPTTPEERPAEPPAAPDDDDELPPSERVISLLLRMDQLLLRVFELVKIALSR